jgi:hypothetical protein
LGSDAANLAVSRATRSELAPVRLRRGRIGMADRGTLASHGLETKLGRWRLIFVA